MLFARRTDMGVTIHATPTGGGAPSTITIDKTGDSTGKIGIDGTNYNVYNVKASADGKKIVCNTKVFLSTVTVTVAVVSESAASSTVSVTLAGTPLGAKDGTTTYTVPTADGTNLKQFVASSHFPVLA
jgi:hypothetical protein